MKRGQVYYTDLRPVIGCEQGGVRPCVIIQNDTGNLYSQTVIVAMMTTRKKPALPTHVSVCEKDKSLNVNTTIMLEQIRTVDKKRLISFMCDLSVETMEKVDKALEISLALNKERKEEVKPRELIRIGNTDIAIKEYKGQRVVTFKDIDAAHGRPDGTANKRFLDNKKRFVEEEDYFKISNSEIRKSLIIPISDNDFTDKVLVTEQGYLMLVKSFTDDLAWDVQRQLVNGYFRSAKPISQAEMMHIEISNIDKRVTNLEDIVSVLENTITLDYGQQRVLAEAIKKSVISVIGGKESAAYREISKKVFAECNRDLKNYFKVNVRGNVPKKRYEDAVAYAENWKPCTNTMMLIDEYNIRKDKQ